MSAGRTKTPVAERFWPKVDKSSTCWNWTAGTGTDGYGRFTIARGKMVLSHRLAYELSVGPIPEGMQIDHMCFNHSCVNPSHLRPVTPEQNSRNRQGAAKHGSSGYRGVHWQSQVKKWQARAMLNGTYHSAGLFVDPAEAAAAAQALRDRLYGKGVSA